MKNEYDLPNVETLNSNVWKTLLKIARKNKTKLFYTFSLVAVENIMFLVYPIFAGISINAILEGNLWLALTYSIVVLVAWGVGASRRIVDTKTFAKIYAELAVPVIIKQKEQGEEVSTIATRVALSREFVDFFEEHLPMFITSVASVLGAVFMLLFIEFWIGVLSFVILFVFVLMLPKFTKKTDEIYFQLNNQLEKEVEHIEKSDINTLNHHYGIIARLRISISNREALNYLLIGFLVCLLFTFGIVVMIINNTQDAGHIYSVMTYLWMFAISLDDSPRLMEQFSKLNDIGKRIHIE